jgi:hypothetical protein
MATLFDTLQLDTSTWDLMLDSSRNIAVQTGSAAVAQDVASIVQTFQGEVWFDTAQGIPYFTQILGQPVNGPLFEALYNQAALTVPGVVSAFTSFTGVSSARKLTGTVEVIDTTGQSMNAHF